MIGYCPLASGSKGNCIYVGTARTKILIDAGISAKMTAERLSQIGVNLDEIAAILITHEHIDHIRGLSVLAMKRGIPVFANAETAKGIYAALNVCPTFKIFTTGETFQFHDLEIHPFSVQHDTLDPVAFTLSCEGIKLGVCADLGFATTLVKHRLQGCDFLYLEANHQPSMVHASPRPMTYKQRGLSRQGHLSNEDCAELLVEVVHPGLKHVHLAHLSSECNAPELAKMIVEEKLKEKGFSVPLSIAWQDKIGQPVIFESVITKG
jgi:phosphoribosyl 1,2-cyclic phosphodiesterase